MDNVSSERRSEIMKRIRSKDTRPERAVRSVAHALGLRFRLHRKDLPGTPDLVFPKWHVCIFVHGCFWHRHENCRRSAYPKSRTEYWARKIERNVERDQAQITALTELGWRVCIIWECETRKKESIVNALQQIFATPPTK